MHCMDCESWLTKDTNEHLVQRLSIDTWCVDSYLQAHMPHAVFGEGRGHNTKKSKGRRIW